MLSFSSHVPPDCVWSSCLSLFPTRKTPKVFCSQHCSMLLWLNTTNQIQQAMGSIYFGDDSLNIIWNMWPLLVHVATLLLFQILYFIKCNHFVLSRWRRSSFQARQRISAIMCCGKPWTCNLYLVDMNLSWPQTVLHEEEAFNLSSTTLWLHRGWVLSTLHTDVGRSFTFTWFHVHCSVTAYEAQHRNTITCCPLSDTQQRRDSAGRTQRCLHCREIM